MSIIQLVGKCTPAEWHVPLELSPLPGRGRDAGLWVDPVTLIRELNGWELATWAMQTSHRLQFWALPKPAGPGAPPVYHDESVLLTSLVGTAWRLSYERIVDWLARYEFLAAVALYHLRIHIVRADAAYFNYAFLGFVRHVLHASVNVGFNHRRQGKRRWLADWFFVRQWRDLMR